MSKAVEASDIFVCKQCGECCRGYGGTYVTPEDITKISKFIGSSSDTFIRKYCVMSGNRPVLKQGKNEYCIFWDKLCTIHPVKPRMCREWPFIEPVLRDVGNWRAMAGSCPGIRTGVPDDKIRTVVEKEISRR